MSKTRTYICPLCGKVACRFKMCDQCIPPYSARGVSCGSYTESKDNICSCSAEDFIRAIIMQRVEIERLMHELKRLDPVVRLWFLNER